MRRTFFPLTLALLLGISAFAIYQTSRVSTFQHQLEHTQRQALLQSAESMQTLTLALEKLLISTHAARQAELLYDIAASAGDVQLHLASLPLEDKTLTSILVLTGHLQADASACLPKTTQSALSTQDLNAFSDNLATCARLSSQLALARDDTDSQLSDALHSEEYPLVRAIEPAAPRGLPQEEFTREQAHQAARAFIGEDIVSQLTDAPDASGALPAYGLTAEAGDVQLNLEITRQGGKVLWMMPETASFSIQQLPQDCITAALSFLESRGFAACEAVHYQIYDGLCVISAVPLQDGVLCYPDLLSIQVRMDTLQIVGLEARSYWTNHMQRTFSPPSLSAADARSRLSAGLVCTETRLCLIPMGSSEILCWQCSGTRNGDLYYIYIDAHSGEERAIRKVIPLESGTTAA